MSKVFKLHLGLRRPRSSRYVSFQDKGVDGFERKEIILDLQGSPFAVSLAEIKKWERDHEKGKKRILL